MTYLAFLALFLAPPLTLMAVVTLAAMRRGRGPTRLALAALAAHVGLAVIYTTPWDNYLVATRVWWYDPARVIGITLGYVPLEEYLFFVAQSLLAGLCVLAIRSSPSEAALAPAGGQALRRWAAGLVGAMWLAAVLVLLVGWRPGRYLALELAWALPPLAAQLAVGADLLWRRRRVLLALILGLTLYLCAADFAAVQAGVWTIDPAQSLGLLAGNVLPIEEIVFFLLTNSLVFSGLTLAMAPEARERLGALQASARRGRPARRAA
jgi:lycopene cyclase domain-containing protein